MTSDGAPTGSIGVGEAHPNRGRLLGVIEPRPLVPLGCQSGEKMLRDTLPCSMRKMTEVQLPAF
jgi:hypothetical protein